MAADLFLALETSGPLGSVALAVGGEKPEALDLPGQRRHTAELLPGVARLLHARGAKLGDVAVLCFSAGPGSFTGLRLAAAVARMAHSVTGCRVVRVSTLEVMARNAAGVVGTDLLVTPVMDSKPGWVFSATYRREASGVLAELAPPAMRTVDDFVGGLRTTQARCGAPWLALGAGLARLSETIRAAGGQVADQALWTPSAANVLEIGHELANLGRDSRPEDIVPIYLRAPECEEAFEPRRAAAVARRRQKDSADPANA